MTKPKSPSCPLQTSGTVPTIRQGLAPLSFSDTLGTPLAACASGPPKSELLKLDLQQIKDKIIKGQGERAGERSPGGSIPGLQQHQETLEQLKRSGLVRRRTERLEKLSGLFQERARPQECPILTATPHSADTPERPSTSLNLHSRLLITSSDFWTSVPTFEGSGVSTPILPSPHGSTLTRSSSSDSIRSVRGKPGLVRQRAQEIETRMRLAGLTVPSCLKRSNSLAKLASLTFSTEDLCSSACSSDAGTLLLLTLSPEGTMSPNWDLHSPDRMWSRPRRADRSTS